VFKPANDARPIADGTLSDVPARSQTVPPPWSTWPR